MLNYFNILMLKTQLKWESYFRERRETTWAADQNGKSRSFCHWAKMSRLVIADADDHLFQPEWNAQDFFYYKKNDISQYTEKLVETEC